MAKYFFVFVIILCLGMGSCSKKEEKAVNCANWTTQISSEATAFTNAAMTWGLNQTAANCTTLKNAAQAYVNALKKFNTCSTTWDAATKAQWQEAVTQTEQQISTLCK